MADRSNLCIPRLAQEADKTWLHNSNLPLIVKHTRPKVFSPKVPGLKVSILKVPSIGNSMPNNLSNVSRVPGKLEGFEGFEGFQSHWFSTSWLCQFVVAMCWAKMKAGRIGQAAQISFCIFGSCIPFLVGFNFVCIFLVALVHLEVIIKLVLRPNGWWLQPPGSKQGRCRHLHISSRVSIGFWPVLIRFWFSFDCVWFVERLCCLNLAVLSGIATTLSSLAKQFVAPIFHQRFSSVCAPASICIHGAANFEAGSPRCCEGEENSKWRDLFDLSTQFPDFEF